MTTGTLDTVIRMNVDSAQGVASTNKLNTAMTTLKSRGVNTLGSGFGSLATQAIAASGATERLGVQGTFLSGTLSMAAQSVGMMSPLLLALTIAGTAAATMFFNKSKQADDATASLEKNAVALDKVAKGNSAFAESARKLLEIRKQNATAQLLQVETDIKLAESGMRTATTLDMIKIGLMGGWAASKTHAAQTGLLNVGLDEQTQILTDLYAKWQKLNEIVSDSDGGKDASQAARDLLSAQERVLGLREKLLAAEGGASRSQASEIMQERIRILEAGTALEIEKYSESAEMVALIEQEKQLRIAAIRLEFSEAYPAILEGETVTVEYNAERQLHAWARTYQAQETLVERMTRIHGIMMSRMNKTAVEAEQGRISILQAGAKIVLGTVADTVAAELDMRAKLWAAQALAAAASFNFGSAALYTAAAAAAGIGAAFVRGQADQLFLGSQSNQSVDELSLTGDSTGGSTQRNGRTLVQQGPITLNYHAVLTVQGHILDITDLHDLFDEWNGDQLRRAGFDTKQRARGNG